jgi:hypothetical protein
VRECVTGQKVALCSNFDVPWSTIEVKHSLKPLLMESRYDMYNLHIMLSFFTLDISKKLVHITQYI